MFTPEKIDSLAAIAGLSLTYSEKETIRKYLEELAVMLAEIPGDSLEDVSPFSGVIRGANYFRPDEVDDTLKADEILANAPETWKRYFLFPENKREVKRSKGAF